MAKYKIKNGGGIIPEGTKVIENSAFSYRKGLTSVIIPDSVKEIGEGAFSDCTELTEIIIPNSVASIGMLAKFRLKTWIIATKYNCAWFKTK